MIPVQKYVDYITSNANSHGEFLRDLVFKESYGCYSCFDLVDGFEPIPNDSIGLFDRTLLLGNQAKNSDEIRRIRAFKNDSLNIIVMWFWDGDGTLLFNDLNNLRRIVNTDCKSSYCWEYVEGTHWIWGVLNCSEYYDA